MKKNRHKKRFKKRCSGGEEQGGDGGQKCKNLAKISPKEYPRSTESDCEHGCGGKTVPTGASTSVNVVHHTPKRSVAGATVTKVCAATKR